MSAAPLAGVTVVELGASVAAPAAGQILADLGADVIKIEKAQGDDARHWGPPFVDGASAMFQALNRRKKSVVCDLRNKEQVERLKQLVVDRVDVVVQNLRPGQVDSLGLGASDLVARKPQLVYCNMGAFGRRGPLSRQPGYDPLMQAFGGIMSVVGEEGRPPVRVAPSIIDVGTAMWAVVGIASALFDRKTTGKGAVIDVSLFETAASWMTLIAAQYCATGQLPRRMGSGQGGIAPYRAFRTADGDLVVAAPNDALFRKFCGVLGRPEWVHDARFRRNADRVKNAPELNALIETEMVVRPSAQWMEAFDGAGVPCAPVQNVARMLGHEQLKALGLLQEVPGLSIPLIGLPLSFDGERPGPGSAAPALGQHTKEVL
jgi:crotonobetainyl-CoA:carnitine CoA-transferase CaiB-like acyl-CoA transferase